MGAYRFSVMTERAHRPKQAPTWGKAWSRTIGRGLVAGRSEGHRSRLRGTPPPSLSKRVTLDRRRRRTFVSHTLNLSSDPHKKYKEP